MMSRFSMLNVGYDNITSSEAIRQILSFLQSSIRRNVFFLNADCLRISQKDNEYRQILNRADLVLPDGIGLKLVTRLYGGRMINNCCGTDIAPFMMERVAQGGYKVFFLGGREGVGEKAAENMRRRFPTIKIVGTHCGYGMDDREVIKKINDSGANILFVAMGVPKQEKWIAKHREQLNPKLCLAVGALLDYLSGTIPRAPLWMRKANLEWFWRIFVEPKRMIKRYLIHGVGFMVYIIFLRFCPWKVNQK